MITCILTIGTMNLLLGFFLALKFEGVHNVLELIEAAPATEQKVNTAEPEGEEVSVEAIVEAEAETQIEEAGEPLVTIPDEWLTILADEGIEANSLVEAATHVLRLKVDEYREELVHLEEYLFQSPSDAGLTEIQAKTVELNRRWLEAQNVAHSHLTKKRTDLGEYYELGEQLDRVLVAQSEVIEMALREANANPEPRQKDLPKIQAVTRSMIHKAHQLRDCIQQSLVAILRSEERLDDFERKVQLDDLTGFHNRHGLEVQFRDWWNEDPNKQKPLSVGVIDLDLFGQLNERFGARPGDKVLQSFADLLTELNEQGAVIGRFSGSAFLYFFGDMGIAKATSEIETARQSLAAASFRLGSEEIDLTISCGVTAVMPEDKVEFVYKRVLKAVAAARRGDGNRTYKVDADDELSPANPPEFRVDERTISVRL